MLCVLSFCSASCTLVVEAVSSLGREWLSLHKSLSKAFHSQLKEGDHKIIERNECNRPTRLHIASSHTWPFMRFMNPSPNLSNIFLKPTIKRLFEAKSYEWRYTVFGELDVEIEWMKMLSKSKKEEKEKKWKREEWKNRDFPLQISEKEWFFIDFFISFIVFVISILF